MKSMKSVNKFSDKFNLKERTESLMDCFPVIGRRRVRPFAPLGLKSPFMMMMNALDVISTDESVLM